jgi:hypothetical protein
MNFSEALKCLARGLRVSRAGWNGKGMWIKHVPEWTAQMNMNMGEDWNGYLSFIVMFTADKYLVPWICSHTDMLAEDWGVV